MWALSLNGEEIYNYTPEEKQRWITGFDPSHQTVQAKDLQSTVKISGGTIHGHPITKNEYLKLLK